MKQIKIVLFLFWALSLSNCKNMEEEKYEWLATVSAPQEYPMEVYSGAVIANDFSYGFDSIWGTQNTGWGNSGGTMSVSTKEMEIPHTLEFTWLSLVEKKFYTGKWALDKEKIAQLFKNGFIDRDTQRRITYNEFKIGLAPKGRVVLWINVAGIQKEVGVFQAHDTIITKQEAYENAQYMLEDDYADKRLKSDFLIKPDVREHITKYGYPNPDIYDVYREKYHWRPILESTNRENWDTAGFNAYNGEMEDIFGEELIKNEYVSRAVPSLFAFCLKDDEQNEICVWVDPFDEDEILSAFQKLGKEENIDLVCKMTADNKNCRVFLRNKKEEIEIKKATITCEKLK